MGVAGIIVIITKSISEICLVMVLFEFIYLTSKERLVLNLCAYAYLTLVVIHQIRVYT